MSAVVKYNSATPALESVYHAVAAGRRRALFAAASGRVARRLRRHFVERENSGDSRRARKGWKSRHFWAEVSRATQVSKLADYGAVVSVASRPFLQKLKGGTIRPKRGKYLAIPLRAEAYAKGSPREWDASTMRSEMRLVPIRSRRGSLLLVQVLDGYAKGALGARGIRAQYLLVRFVTQRPDPRALPPAGTLEAEVDAGVAEFVEGEMRRGVK